MPHVQLVMVDGDALGAVELGRPDWPVGSVIYRGQDETNLRIVQVIDADRPDDFTVLVVEPVESGKAKREILAKTRQRAVRS